MPELLEPPIDSQAADSDALKASFTAALAAVESAPKEEQEPSPNAVPKKDPAPELKKEDEPLVPKEFTEKPKPAVTETKPEDELPPNAGAKQLREALARREARIKELQTEREQFRQKAETAPTGPSKEQEAAHKATMERAAALEEKLERVAYQESPKFKKFAVEEAAEITSAKAYLEGTEANPSVLDLAARASGQARLKLLRDAGLDAETIAVVGPHLARVDSIRREQTAALDNWKESVTVEREQQKAQQAQREAAMQAEEKAVFNSVKEEMMKLPAFQLVENHPKWNLSAEKRAELAENFFNGKASLKDLATMGFKAIAYDAENLMRLEGLRIIDEQAEELGRLRAAQPGTGKAADPKGDTTQPVSEIEHHKSRFSEELAKVQGG